MIPDHYKSISHGFWDFSVKNLPTSVQDVLPSTTDRFLECVHFAELAISLPPIPENEAKVNWYTSAHMAAYISIFDAVKHEVETSHPGVDFQKTPVAKERNASSQSSHPLYRDPVNASQLYRAKRNLRVHFAVPPVVLEVREITSEDAHFYMSLIDPVKYRLLKYAPLSDDELRQYNGYLHMDTILDKFGRMIGIIKEVIIETATMVALPGKDA